MPVPGAVVVAFWRASTFSGRPCDDGPCVMCAMWSQRLARIIDRILESAS